MKPLAIDLFCGLGGWSEGLLAEGWRVRGYDIEAHEYGDQKYPAELVIADVLDLHGSQFSDADLIVASPPCQEYSYMAMPWSRAKAKAAAIRADETGAELERLNRLFNACFRIQKEASIAAGRHIPLIVENVRGAIPWVGRSRYNFGSFHLWGDVPALMPRPSQATKNECVGGGSWFAIGSPGQKTVGGNPDGRKVPGFRFVGSGRSFQTASVEGTKVPSEAGRRTDPGKGARFTSRDCGVERQHGVDHETGTKTGGDWFSDPTSTCRRHGSKSKARKAASAMIAKIPEPLSRHIARTFLPARSEAA